MDVRNIVRIAGFDPRGGERVNEETGERFDNDTGAQIFDTMKEAISWAKYFEYQAAGGRAWHVVDIGRGFIAIRDGDEFVGKIVFTVEPTDSNPVAIKNF
jgi:hypothetical protein